MGIMHVLDHQRISVSMLSAIKYMSGKSIDVEIV